MNHVAVWELYRSKCRVWARRMHRTDDTLCPQGMRRRKTRPLGSLWRLFSIVSKCIKVKDLDISGRDQEVFLTNFAIEAARLIG